MERARGPGVVVGAVAGCVSLLTLEAFRLWVVSPYIYAITTDPSRGPGGSPIRTWTSGEQWERYLALGDLSLVGLLFAASLVFFLICVAIGRAAPSSPGLTGATSAALALALAFACLLLGGLAWASNPWADPAGRFDRFGYLIDYGAVLFVLSPLATLSGYLGGKLGGRSRSRATGPAY